MSSIWLKTISDYQTLVLIASAAMFLVMGVVMGPMYASIPEETLKTFDQLPENLVALFGGGNMSTPEVVLAGNIRLDGTRRGDSSHGGNGRCALAGRNRDERWHCFWHVD